jgi:protein-disulfide isomerase
MFATLRSIILGAALALVALVPAVAAGFDAAQRSEIEKIIREYLIANPQVLQDVMMELEKRQVAMDAQRQQAAVRENAKELFSSSRHVVVGNPQGNVTMVEFFDYNCGYCKRAMDDMMVLLKNDRNLRVVLKEFPVLGPSSLEAAKVATAVRIQDKTGKKYLDFHQRLMGGRGQADKARALAAAKDAGFDVAKIEKDLEGEEVKASLQESFKLAQALGLNGTPSYVIGDKVIIGAVGLEALQEGINTARCGKPTC